MKLSGKIRPLLVIVIVIAALAGGYWTGRWHDDHAGHADGTTDAATQWTCGMHPFIIQDEPGICPICNMELTPLKPGTGGQPAAERQIKHWVSPMDPSTTWCRSTRVGAVGLPSTR